MSGRPSYRWMHRCTELLFERIDDARARSMLTDPNERSAAYAELAQELTTHGMPEGLLASSEGESLGVAMLALRLRFDRETALQKVDLNIAMREGRA